MYLPIDLFPLLTLFQYILCRYFTNMTPLYLSQSLLLDIKLYFFFFLLFFFSRIYRIQNRMVSTDRVLKRYDISVYFVFFFFFFIRRGYLTNFSLLLKQLLTDGTSNVRKKYVNRNTRPFQFCIFYHPLFVVLSLLCKPSVFYTIVCIVCVCLVRTMGHGYSKSSLL